MNANELADELDVASSEMEYNHVVDDWKLLSASATMLRQQQAKLEQFGLAESIIKQQELQIQDLKDEMAEWKMSYENCHRMCNGYGMN